MEQQSQDYREFDRAGSDKEYSHLGYLDTLQARDITYLYGIAKAAMGAPCANQDHIVCDVLQQWADVLFGTGDSFGHATPELLCVSVAGRILAIEDERPLLIPDQVLTEQWLSQLLTDRARYFLCKQNGSSAADPGYIHLMLPRLADIPAAKSTPGDAAERQAIYARMRGRGDFNSKSFVEGAGVTMQQWYDWPKAKKNGSVKVHKNGGEVDKKIRNAARRVLAG